MRHRGETPSVPNGRVLVFGLTLGCAGLFLAVLFGSNHGRAGSDAALGILAAGMILFAGQASARVSEARTIERLRAIDQKLVEINKELKERRAGPASGQSACPKTHS